MRLLRTQGLLLVHVWSWEVAGLSRVVVDAPCGPVCPQRRGEGREEGGSMRRERVGRGKGGKKGIEVKECLSLSY